MPIVDDIRSMFPEPSFGAACTEADIRGAEETLGEPLPSVLRELYLAFNGFRGSTNARFFWPLFGPEGLVRMNQFYRCDDLFPQDLVSQCLFFGDNGCGPQWGFKRASRREWHPERSALDSTIRQGPIVAASRGGGK